MQRLLGNIYYCIYVRYPSWLRIFWKRSGKLKLFVPACLLQTEPSCWSWSVNRSDVLQECGRWTWSVLRSRTDGTGWSGTHNLMRVGTVVQRVGVSYQNGTSCLRLPSCPDPWSPRACRGRGWTEGRSRSVCPTAECGTFLQETRAGGLSCLILLTGLQLLTDPLWYLNL